MSTYLQDVNHNLENIIFSWLSEEPNYGYIVPDSSRGQIMPGLLPEKYLVTSVDNVKQYAANSKYDGVLYGTRSDVLFICPFTHTPSCATAEQLARHLREWWIYSVRDNLYIQTRWD